MPKKKRFLVVTADHSGMPLALRLQDEGHPVAVLLVRPELADGKRREPKDSQEAKRFRERTKYLKKNGSGLVRHLWIDEVWEDLLRLDKESTYIIFDQIYGWQFGEALRKAGFKVLGGTKFGYELETNRDATLQLFKRLGVDVPLMKKFGPNSVQAGIEFLRQVKDEMLFVLKSDNPQVVTQVAQDTNEELIQKLQTEQEEINKDGFILQQKVEGVELAVETWYCNGQPVLSNVDIEAKRKYNESSEVQVGCSFDLLWIIPTDHELATRVNGPLDKLAVKVKTGLLDLSVIYDHRAQKFWALEPCGSRFAYNAFYTMLTLLKVPVGEFLAAYMDGEFTNDIGKKLFTGEYGVSLRVFNDEKTPDQPIDFPEELSPYVWLWDAYLKNGKLYTTGDESVGIITAKGENPEAAFAKLREYYHKFYMPTKWARDDYDDEDVPTLPLARYHELKRLGVI
ncbi:MAG: hypothetical protein AB7V08_14930 [Elusimicrobiales bacterium]